MKASNDKWLVIESPQFRSHINGESFYESDSLDEYCEEKSSQSKELEEVNRYLFSQVRFEYEC